MSTVDRHRSEYAASAPSAAPAAVPVAAPIKGGFRISTFDALHFRDYRFLWIGILFTSSGMAATGLEDGGLEVADTVIGPNYT